MIFMTGIDIDELSKEVMKGLQEYSELADSEMKKAVRETATSVKKEIYDRLESFYDNEQYNEQN